jgi:hypothetical protein
MIAVVDDLPVFRLLATRRINQAKHGLVACRDALVQSFPSVADLLVWVNAHDHGLCQLLLLDYTFAHGETSIARLPEILHHPKLAQSIVVGWSRTNESARDFRHHGAHGFISKDRSDSLVTDMLHIIKQYQAGINWIEML